MSFSPCFSSAQMIPMNCRFACDGNGFCVLYHSFGRLINTNYDRPCWRDSTLRCTTSPRRRRVSRSCDLPACLSCNSFVSSCLVLRFFLCVFGCFILSNLSNFFLFFKGRNMWEKFLFVNILTTTVCENNIMLNKMISQKI